MVSLERRVEGAEASALVGGAPAAEGVSFARVHAGILTRAYIRVKYFKIVTTRMYVLVMTALAPAALVAEDRLVAAHSRLNAVYCDLFAQILDHERREAYLVDGARSMADWLGYRFGYSEHTARELCRVARALEYLPAIYEAFRDGSLTYDKVRWLTEFCTPDEEAGWACDAIGMSAAHVRMFAIHRRRLARELADRRFQRRYLKIVMDIDQGEYRFWGRLPEAEGAAFKKAIDLAADRRPRDPDTGGLVDIDRRRADALVEMCSANLAAQPDPDRATLVCHVDAHVLRSPDGVASLEGGMPVGAETVRRLLCDGRLQTVVHRNGHPIGAGSVTRVVPPYLRRVVLHRDGGCIWPGCTNRNWLHAHHVTHVVHGGRTVEDNLTMLCGSHHRLVHEGGWRMKGRPGRDLRILRPDGQPLRVTPHLSRPSRR